MGNCKILKRSAIDKTYSSLITHNENSQIFQFNVTISKLKLRDIPESVINERLVSVSLRFPNEFFLFPEHDGVSEIYHWDALYKFVYQATLTEIENHKLEILVMCGKKNKCSAEIKIKSIIDGPMHQNRSLTRDGLEIGRVSFDAEFQ